MYNYFRLLDLDGEAFGILKTKMPEEQLKKEFVKWYDKETEDLCIENFVEVMTSSFPEYYFERFFIDAVITPTY